jgi:hypothetical protein
MVADVRLLVTPHLRADLKGSDLASFMVVASFSCLGGGHGRIPTRLAIFVLPC